MCICPTTVAATRSPILIQINNRRRVNGYDAGMAPIVNMSEAIDTLAAAISEFREQLELTNRLVEQLNQARDAEIGRPEQPCCALADQALAKLQAERDAAEALRIQLESEVERMRAELAEARHPWWHRLKAA